MLPGEAMNRAIATVTGKKYEDIKIFFDVFYICVSVVIGVSLLGGLKGVREGSIIKLYNCIWNKITTRKERMLSEGTVEEQF